VYERLDVALADHNRTFNMQGVVQHMTFIGDFPLWKRSEKRDLTLDEITAKISEMIAKK